MRTAVAGIIIFMIAAAASALAAKVCPECQKECPDEHLYCEDCGAKLVGEEPGLEVFIEITPNPARIPEKYTVKWVVRNNTKEDVKIYSAKKGNAEVELNKNAPAGCTVVVRSGGGTTYTPGTFHNTLVIYSSAGTFEARPVDFIVKP
jgi:hypothetical protein